MRFVFKNKQFDDKYGCDPCIMMVPGGGGEFSMNILIIGMCTKC